MSIQLSEFRPVTRLRAASHSVPRPKYPVFDIHTHFGPLVIGKDYPEKYDTAAVIEGLQAYGVYGVCNVELVWEEELERMRKKLTGFETFALTFPSIDLSGYEQPDFPEKVHAVMAAYARAGYLGIKLWKDITLYRKDSRGNRIRLDDRRLGCIFDSAAQFGLRVLIHIADPIAFFTPHDARNEYYECLENNPQWLFYGDGHFSFEEHMAMQETLLARHPDTVFIIAHVGSCAEDLGYVGGLLKRYPNMHIDIAARIHELGRQPVTARAFFLDYADRILFGTDYIAGQDPAEVYPYYYRFLETFDEYFDYGPEKDVGSLGRWKIYGIGLPDEVLRKVYAQNAQRLLKAAERGTQRV